MWINLQAAERIEVLNQVSVKTGLPEFVIEKDWWVCIILKAIFQSKFKGAITFKGGTSLSKAYALIERFSEDIDLIIDRHLLGFEEFPSLTQIKKLRKASGSFIINEFRVELIAQLTKLEVETDQYTIEYDTHVDDLSDPNTLEIIYKSVVPTSGGYIKQRVLLEMSARSLTEPSEEREITSFIDEEFKELPFTNPPFNVLVVTPTKTFIEKTLLLHEEFTKPFDKIRTERLTRHLYDLERIMDTDYGKEAVVNDELFENIVKHRKIMSRVKNINYEHHEKGKLKIIPPDEVIEKWKDDYKTMQENMIAGKNLDWDDLLTRIKEIETRFNNYM